MKKLIVSLALVCAAVAANAATFNWKGSGSSANKIIYAKGSTTTTLYSANNAAILYLFDAGVVSQDALLTSLRDGGSITSLTSVASQSLADTSKIVDQEFTYGVAGNDYNFYTAVINGDDILITASTQVGAQATDTPDVSFGSLKSISSAAGFGDTATFASNGAGWYAIPEPTSGMLLLVGCALMALKRKRA